MKYNEKSVEIAIGLLDGSVTGCPHHFGLKSIDFDRCKGQGFSCNECWKEALMKEPEGVENERGM